MTGRKGDTVVDRDEHIRPDANVETLAKLRPIMGRDDAGGHRHRRQRQRAERRRRGRVVTTPEKAAELGLRPLARLVSWGVGGVPPRTMGIGPVPATAKALAQADVKLADVDLIELNEAFASQVLAVTREWGFTDERLRAHQRQRLGHLAGPPGRRDRRPDPGHAAARDGPPRGPLRPGDDVHRRRPGPGGAVRAGLRR